MDIKALKKYAQQARHDFKRAVSDRMLNLISGDSAAAEALKIEARHGGRDAIIEHHACFWFNRFMALRYMEVQGCLEYRVLSGRGESRPEVMAHALELAYEPPFEASRVRELLSCGDRDEELYRYLLLRQCHLLSTSMPFLFDKVSAISAGLLPDGLLTDDSIVRKLTTELEEEDWRAGTEIFGWLYQFYSAESKRSLAGRIDAPQDLAAATQFFTPDWLADYLVQNGMGRSLPLLADSEAAYFVKPDGPGSIASAGRLEAVTVLDPACGSGHILVKAYRLLREGYLKQGYSRREIPRLILEKNIYGLDIDPHAVQLAGFALMMEAANDDEEILSAGVLPQVFSLVDGSALDVERHACALLRQPGAADETGGVVVDDFTQLAGIFARGDLFGSLLRVPAEFIAKIPAVVRSVQQGIDSGDAETRQAALAVLPLARVADLLSRRYSCIVTNPPYLSARFMGEKLSRFARKHYPDSRADLYSMFMERSFELVRPDGAVSMLTMHGWMFLPSYQRLRAKILSEKKILSLLHLGARAFQSISGEVVQASAFTIAAFREAGPAVFFDLRRGGEHDKRREFLEKTCPSAARDGQSFLALPGAPLAYWASSRVIAIFNDCRRLQEFAEVRQGLATGDNSRFLRYWFEVERSEISFDSENLKDALASGKKWFPYNKGGAQRRWYGNHEYVIAFDQEAYEALSRSGNCLPSRQYYFRPGVTWTLLSSKTFNVRLLPPGFLFDVNGMSLFTEDELVENQRLALLGFLASKVCYEFLRIINPTLAFQAGNIKTLPISAAVLKECSGRAAEIVSEAVGLSREDWDEHELSWDFMGSPLLRSGIKAHNLEGSCLAYQTHCRARMLRLQQLEVDNNGVFIAAYGLQSEITPDVPLQSITVGRGEVVKTVKEFISYAVGCALGRFSFEAGEGIAAVDGILLLSGGEDCDGLNRLMKFLEAAWRGSALKINLRFMADNLGPRARESARQTIRRYLSEGFFRDHVKTYKKRPIYQLVDSGPEGAFRALVYKRRSGDYAARLRTEYLLPAMAGVARNLERLRVEFGQEQSAERRKTLAREIAGLERRVSEMARK